MFAGEWSVLQKPNNRVVGPSGVLEGGTGGAAVVSPTALAGTEAWYDIQDPSSMVIDGSNRVSLVADKSGNSAENGLVLNGVAGNYASTPDSAALSPAGSFDIDVGVALNDWTPSTTQALLGKDDAASERSFLLFITATTGVPVCNVFDSAGASFGFVCSTAPTVADHQLLYLRAKITWALAGNCLCDFFTSTDGVSWSALGTQQSIAATGNAIKDSAVAFSIGQRVSGSNQLPSTGIFYRARLYSGDRDSGGTLAFDADFTAQSKLATSFTESSSNAATVTINQTAIALPARIHGARDRYQGVAASQPYYVERHVDSVEYQSDFSAGTDGTSGVDNTLSAPENSVSDGTTSKDNCLLATITGTRPRINLGQNLSIGRKYNISFTVYCPSGNVNVDGFRLCYGNSTTTYVGGFTNSGVGQNVGNEWVTVSSEFIATSTSELTLFIEPVNSANTGDLFYVSDILITDVASPSAYLYYDGSNDDMRTPPWPLEQPESVYFAGSQVTWTDLDYIYDGGNITDMAFRQQNASGRIYLHAGSLGPYITAGIGENFVAASVFNGASSSNRLNLETAVTGNAGTNAADAFIIGGRGNPFGNYANITETGVIIRSTADDAATQARFIRYLAQKGGISV